MLWTVTVHSRGRRCNARTSYFTRRILIGCFIVCTRQKNPKNKQTNKKPRVHLNKLLLPRRESFSASWNHISAAFFLQPLPFFPLLTEAAKTGFTHLHRAGAAADASHSCMECRNKVRIRPPLGQTCVGSLGWCEWSGGVRKPEDRAAVQMTISMSCWPDAARFTWNTWPARSYITLSRLLHAFTVDMSAPVG